MEGRTRPVPVTILACIYLLVGAAGFVFHFRELLTLQRDGLLVEFTEILAVVAGVFMLLGHNWARWLALAWIAFHVAISIFDIRKLVAHGVIFAIIAWILLTPAAGRYFRRSGTQAM